MFKRFLSITLFCLTTIFIVTMGTVAGFGGNLHEFLSWCEDMQLSSAIIGTVGLGAAIGIGAAVILVTLVFGRIYCLFICPAGVLSDMGAFAGEKIRGTKYGFWGHGKNLSTERILILRMAILGGIVVASVAIGWFIDPSYGAWKAVLGGLKFSTIPVFSVSCILMALMLAGSFFGGRTYCNTICPIGTVLGLLSKFSLYKVRIDKSKCPEGCSKCEARCRCGAIEASTGKIDATLCISCLDCVRGICPKDAISYTPPDASFFLSREYKQVRSLDKSTQDKAQ